ncbi:MAG: hypothetical protein HXY18_03720, partial [Bryobacteraceae bacterium]|nr:hypothetical protein [Bryobacteraceae bacterium]
MAITVSEPARRVLAEVEGSNARLADYERVRDIEVVIRAVSFLGLVIRAYMVRSESGGLMIPQSLDSLEQQRAAIALEIASLGDLRCGSIT